MRIRRKDGREIRALLSRFQLNPNDKSAGSVIVSLDITARKVLEEQLRQSQKMEAIGQLAGGVAHDFNNMLQAILGYTSMVLFSLGPDDKNHNKLMEIEKAAERASSLTRQLLAFSRRQVLQLVPLDLNQVNADRGQMEQVIMNLCLNARDAMRNGGMLSIETVNICLDDDYCIQHNWAKPGRYARLSVTDSGCGMDPETKSRIFEPFYTTKEQGLGMGLGMATVYGIVSQHNGIIHVYSDMGQGSRFTVYLPAMEQNATDIIQESEESIVGGCETILLAEDDEQLRFLATEILTLAGYRVLAAINGEDALRIYHGQKDEIDLLLLDVVMPKKGGRMVYDEIRAVHPAVRCLFMSGYSENAVHTNFILDQGLNLIQKPFKNKQLLKIIRQELDRA